MKPTLFFLSITLFVFSISCKKESTDVSSLLGKWELAKYYVSIGGPGEWVPATRNEGIIFGSNGKLQSSAYNEYHRYILKDSTTLIFFKADGSMQKFLFELKQDQLTLSPAGPMYCFEGCMSKFNKVKD